MGWASGSELAKELIEAAKSCIPDNVSRYLFYTRMIKAFEDKDCDTLYECEGQDPQFDKAMEVLHPEHDEDREVVNEVR